MKGRLRWTEEQFREDAAKRSRWQRGSEVVNTNTTSGGVESRNAPAQEDRPRVGKALPVIADARSTPRQPCAHRAGVAPSPLTPIAHVFKPPTASKYGNKRTNGYASKREAKRAAQLKQMQAAGAISGLREQVAYLLVPKAIGSDGKVVERAAHYVADFVYRNGLGHEIVEDCKGMRTDVYRLKRKLMLMVHGIRILET